MADWTFRTIRTVLFYWPARTMLRSTASLRQILSREDFAVLTMELLTSQEAQFVDATQNVPRLTQRLLDLLDLIRQDGDMQDLPLAIFATGDSCPAAVRVAAQRDTQVKAWPATAA
jgi:hypothetical protein